MKKYIGAKIIQAEPAPASANLGDYLKGDPGYKVVYGGGYISWSPKAVFENAYREVTEEEMDLLLKE